MNGARVVLELVIVLGTAALVTVVFQSVLAASRRARSRSER